MASVALTDDEIAALWLSVWLTASRATAPAARVSLSAFDKVAAGLPTRQRARLHALARHVLLGAAAGRHLAVGSVPPQPAVVAALAAAFSQRSTMEMTYRDAEGRVSTRTVEPHALLVQVPLWYLLAFDRSRETPRTFRLDRVEAATANPAAPFSPRAVGRLFPDLAFAGVTSLPVP